MDLSNNHSEIQKIEEKLSNVGYVHPPKVNPKPIPGAYKTFNHEADMKTGYGNANSTDSMYKTFDAKIEQEN